MSVILKNTGKRDGDEVVQLYATAVNPPVSMPLKQLIGFQRVSLKAGETKSVNLAVPVKELRRWSETGDCYVVDPGEYQIVVGPSSNRPLGRAMLRVVR